MGVLTDNNRLINPLRVFVQHNSLNTLKFYETNIALLQSQNGGYQIPSQHRYNITMCFGIKQTAPGFTVEVRYQPSIEYNGTEWNLGDSSIQLSVQNAALLNEKCLNCGGDHNIDTCNFPDFMHCCVV